MSRTVLIVISEAWFAASHFRPLIKTVVTEADRVVIASRFDAQDPRQTDFIAELDREGIEQYPFDVGRGRLGVRHQLSAVAALRAVVATVRPDVVHVIGQHLIVVVGLAFAVPARRPALVLHLTGRGILATAVGARFAGMRLALRTAITRSVKRGATLLVENSDDAVDTAGRRPDGSSITLVPGAGVNPDIFKPKHACPPQERDQETRPLRVTYMGRMLTFKGLGVLEEAARLLRHQNADVAITCYGAPDDNPNAVPAEDLARWASAPSANRDANFVWHGPTTDAPQVWRETDIAVFPTLGGEGVPRSLLEAAATGVSIIASNVPGCRDVIDDGQTGLLVEPNDARQLADAIACLADDQGLRARLGHAARKRVLERYSEARVRDAYSHVYRRLLRD